MIDKGDIVTVHWERVATLHNVEVIYMPMSNGEAWLLKDKDGNEYMVKDYCSIEKMKCVNE